MDEAMADHRRGIEIVLFLVAYGALYVAVLGPVIGAVLPGFDAVPFRGGSRPTGELPSTAQGWLMIVLGVPALFGYLWLRARLAGETLRGFWNSDEDARD
jgi:hypothetical protein